MIDSLFSDLVLVSLLATVYILIEYKNVYNKKE